MVSDATFVGRAIWIEMDTDKSAVQFTPRKGVIIHGYKHPLEKEDWVVELGSPPLTLFLLPRRLHHLILQYRTGSVHTTSLTFESGCSYAEVLRIKQKEAITSETLTRRDVSRIGAALVYPWPKPEDRALRFVHGNSTKGT
jgi:hypothetical protein